MAANGTRKLSPIGPSNAEATTTILSKIPFFLKNSSASLMSSFLLPMAAYIHI